MKKNILFSIIFSLTSLVFAQKIGILNGPSSIPCVYLMENSNYEFEKFASAQNELPSLVKGEIDIGFLPPNVAAKVFNSNKKSLVCLGIAGNGNLFLMTKDSSAKSIFGLNGKTIFCAGFGATPEYIMKYLLKKNSVNAELDFSIPNAEIAPSLIAGKIEYALIPEPFATVSQTKGENVIRALNISEIFKESERTDFPMTLLVVNANYVKKHKKEIKKFISDYEKASKWTLKNKEEIGKLVEKYEFGLKSQIVSKSIENASYVWIPAKKGKSSIEKLLSIFLENSSESIGGKLPDNDFYY